MDNLIESVDEENREQIMVENEDSNDFDSEKGSTADVMKDPVEVSVKYGGSQVSLNFYNLL